MDSQENDLLCAHSQDLARPRRAIRRGFLLMLAGNLAFAWLALAGCRAPHSNKQLDVPLLQQAFNTIQKEYVDQSAVKPMDATYGAIGGMVDALGDTGHSTFLTPEMVKTLKEAERGVLKGIGVEIQNKGGQVVVVAPIDGSPAQRAGLRPGDVILKVNGADISDWPLGEVVGKITGPAGTQVQLTILAPRTGRTREVAVTRATIHLHEVTWLRLPGTDVVDLRISSFEPGTTRDLRKALTEIQQQPTKGIILDLRENPGGLLDEAISTASQFLAGGDVLEEKDAQGKVAPIPVERDGVATNIPMAVLIDEGTASGAEIVSGALRDANRAPLIGMTTFGTGTVLEQFSLSDGSALLLAVGEWLTPKGQSFWHKGIAPQIKLELPDDASPLLPVEIREMSAEQLRSSHDRQLLKALEVLEHPGQLEELTRVGGDSRETTK